MTGRVLARPGVPLPRQGLMALAAGLVLWELAALQLNGTFLLAAPSAVALHLWQHAGLIGRALGVTLTEAALGFVFGNLAAMVMAVLVVLLPRGERLISALALIVFCLPLVATGPILRVLYGPGIGPQVTLAALAVYYTTYLPLLVGLRAAPATWFDLVQSYGRGRLTALLRVRTRAALPYLLAGLQIAAPAAVLGAMVGEFTGAERGMGVLVIRALAGLDIAGTWALALVAATVSILAYVAIGAVGRRLRATQPELILSAPTPAPGARPVAGLNALISTMVVTMALLGLWWGSMALFDLNPFFAKRPADVMAFLFTAPEAPANRAVLLAALAETLALAVPGYLAGLALGAGLAAALTLVPRLGLVALPVAIALRSVPILSTAPLLVLLLGRGALGGITIVAVMTFFPALVACLQGLRQTPGQVLAIFDSYGAGRLQRLRLAQAPAMLPAFFAAARMAVPAAMLAATTAEWLATGRGIGALLALTASTSAYGMLWSATVVLALLSAAGYALVSQIEAGVLRRYATEQLRR